jgi:hypothetical protein
MDTKKFLFEVEMRLTSLAPEMVPGVLKKQFEILGVTNDSMTPSDAKKYIDNVAEALHFLIGPEGSNNAKKLMMRKLRQSCSSDELECLMMK